MLRRPSLQGLRSPRTSLHLALHFISLLLPLLSHPPPRPSIHTLPPYLLLLFHGHTRSVGCSRRVLRPLVAHRPNHHLPLLHPPLFRPRSRHLLQVCPVQKCLGNSHRQRRKERDENAHRIRRASRDSLSALETGPRPRGEELRQDDWHSELGQCPVHAEPGDQDGEEDVENEAERERVFGCVGGRGVGVGEGWIYGVSWVEEALVGCSFGLGEEARFGSQVLGALVQRPISTVSICALMSEDVSAQRL